MPSVSEIITLLEVSLIRVPLVFLINFVNNILCLDDPLFLMYSTLCMKTKVSGMKELEGYKAKHASLSLWEWPI